MPRYRQLSMNIFVVPKWKMSVSHKKLFKLLIDREMKSKELSAKAGISLATLAKMKKDGATVSSDAAHLRWNGENDKSA